ncbi:Uu.00g127470.m01.CDS01 [Anthostomella pinea]|uniref:Uu.00g127470.m01.CDS01 n=1 Tax=Anthostomella pinea TaxID=933095 RepID=A0AAI8YFG9_9PEZI|nr:Uu.00g127470.m01.CDS01 [Anthostomella pinea]
MTDGTVVAQLPLLSRIYHGASIAAVQGFMASMRIYEQWHSWYYATDLNPPSIVKTYECRPSLPIRTFFPESYDQTAPQTLPMLFSIHGGGFCIGDPQDDDAWNVSFANAHDILVVALNYRKAPFYPFPTAIHDLEALMLAVYDDESLPINKSRIAVGGFSAGGNLTLSVCQLPSIREKVKPTAALSIYSVVDQSIPSEEKVKMRYYKPNLGPGLRSSPTDFLARFAPTFTWSYVPVGEDLQNPLVSPSFAPPETLPLYIFILAAELDQLAPEAWRMASKWAGRPVPPLTEKVGQEQPASEKGGLVLDDERFVFEHIGGDGKSSVRWLLVPDQLHGFDHLPPHVHGSEEAFQDAQLKTKKYQELLGDWLHKVVWKA